MWRFVNVEGLDLVEEVGVGRGRRIMKRGNIQPRPGTETRASWGQRRTRFLSTHLANARKRTDQTASTVRAQARRQKSPKCDVFNRKYNQKTCPRLRKMKDWRGKILQQSSEPVKWKAALFLYWKSYIKSSCSRLRRHVNGCGQWRDEYGRKVRSLCCKFS